MCLGGSGAAWRAVADGDLDHEGSNADGGFAESKVVRPRTLRNLRASFTHVWRLGFRGLGERLRYGLTLQRPKHDRIATHWSDYSRECPNRTCGTHGSGCSPLPRWIAC